MTAEPWTASENITLDYFRDVQAFSDYNLVCVFLVVLESWPVDVVVVTKTVLIHVLCVSKEHDMNFVEIGRIYADCDIANIFWDNVDSSRIDSGLLTS